MWQNAWERRSKEQGTPLAKYYATWRQLRDKELQKQMAAAAAEGDSQQVCVACSGGLYRRRYSATFIVCVCVYIGALAIS